MPWLINNQIGGEILHTNTHENKISKALERVKEQNSTKDYSEGRWPA